jgi:hypothetical protein
MTAPLDEVLDGLAEAFGLDRYLLADASALRSAATTALKNRSPQEIVAELVAEGRLAGAANPYAVVIARVRGLCSRPSQAERARARDASRRERQLVASFNHGDLLRRTIGLGYGGAVELLDSDRRYDDPEMMAAALRGFANGPLR